MSKPQKQYAYKYDADSDIGRWLSAQKNKTRSIGYLVQWAFTNFGEQDLIDASIKQMLDSPVPIQPPVTTQSQVAPDPSPNQADHAQPDVKPDMAVPVLNVPDKKRSQPDILATMLK